MNDFFSSFQDLMRKVLYILFSKEKLPHNDCDLLKVMQQLKGRSWDLIL